MRRDQILFWSFLSFMGGTAAASFFFLTSGPALFLVGLALTVVFFVVFSPKTAGILLLFLSLFSFGSLWTKQSLDSFEGLETGEVSAEARVIADPEEKSFYTETILKVERCEGERCPEKRILWQAPLTSVYGAGDRFSFRCSLEMPENFSPDFDYRMFLAKDGIGHICQRIEILTDLPRDAKGQTFRILYFPKHFFEGALSQTLPEPEAGLAKGLLLGGSGYLSENFEEAFRAVGLSHIVAVSGYNITLIIKCFLWLGLAFGLWRRQALYVSLAGITLFILMIGLPSSAIRAACMASLVFLAWEVGRITRPVPVLLFAASLMLLFNPLLLRYDIGFQLSFLATLAIVTVEPFEYRLFPKEFFGVGALKIFWITLVVHIFVLPVILYNFHVFSPLSVLMSVLVIVVPWAMAFSFFAALSFLVPFIHALPALPAYLSLWLVTWPVERVSALPFASVAVTQFSVWHLVLWYAVLLFVMIVLEKYRKQVTRVYPL